MRRNPHAPEVLDVLERDFPLEHGFWAFTVRGKLRRDEDLFGYLAPVGVSVSPLEGEEVVAIRSGPYDGAFAVFTPRPIPAERVVRFGLFPDSTALVPFLIEILAGDDTVALTNKRGNAVLIHRDTYPEEMRTHRGKIDKYRVTFFDEYGPSGHHNGTFEELVQEAIWGGYRRLGSIDALVAKENPPRDRSGYIIDAPVIVDHPELRPPGMWRPAPGAIVPQQFREKTQSAAVVFFDEIVRGLYDSASEYVKAVAVYQEKPGGGLGRTVRKRMRRDSRDGEWYVEGAKRNPAKPKTPEELISALEAVGALRYFRRAFDEGAEDVDPEEHGGEGSEEHAWAAHDAGVDHANDIAIRYLGYDPGRELVEKTRSKL